MNHDRGGGTSVQALTPEAVESLALDAPPDVAVVLLAKGRDPGTRLSEADFLAILKRFMVAR
jgi:hypothetical protein